MTVSKDHQCVPNKCIMEHDFTSAYVQTTLSELSPYRAANTLRLGYNSKSVNVV
jgi:hypothetical protein